ncbi:MAG: transporter permease [Haloplasmataceae bacterium]|jgi:ABC-2 type transport system permease protein|nr:transporter permease [Haloplasmataceae bacterium]
MRIFRLSLKRIIGNKIRLSMLLIIPLLFVLMFLFGSFNTVTVGVVDHDQSKLSKIVIKELQKNPFYNVKIVDKDEMITDVIGYQLDYVIEINDGFEEQIISNELVLVKDYYIFENENVMNVKMYIESYLNNLVQISSNTDSNEILFYQLLNDFEYSNLKINNQNDQSGLIEQASYSIGFTVYFLIYISIITCGLILEDRKNGTLFRIFNSPISLKKYLAENLLSYVIIAFLQVFVIMFTFKYILNFQYDYGFIYLFLLVFIFSLVSITMGLSLIAYIKKPIQAYITVGIVASPLAMLGGCYWPAELMPMWLQTVGKFVPTSWVMSGANEILVNHGTFVDLLDNIGVLILFGIVFFVGGLFKSIDYAKL